MSVLQRFFEESAQALSKASGVKVNAADLSVPPNAELGDASSAVCFELAKKDKKNPVELAKQLAAKIKPTGLIARVEAKGPYVNFFVNQAKLAEAVLKEGTKKGYGASGEGKGRVVVLDYSSTNVAKPMHVGHLRSTIIGQSVRNILEFQGYKTIGVNYLGDWGFQFGKLITAFEKWGSEKELKKDPISYLVALYVRFHKEAKTKPELEEQAREWVVKLEKRDKQAMKYWKEFRDLSIKKFEDTYKLLGVKFDVYSGESEYALSDKTSEVIKEAQDKKIAFQEAPGTIVVPLEVHGINNARLLDNGATLYFTRDIAAAKDRYKRWKFAKSLYVVSSQQDLHFKQLFKTLELLGYAWAKDCAHVNFGYLNLPEGKMSTREGNFVLLGDLLETAVKKAEKIIEQKNPGLKNKRAAAEMVGVGAVVFADLSQNRVKDVTFEWDKALSFEGDTGPYLQYAFVRCNGIIDAVGKTGKPRADSLVNPEELTLTKKLAEFPKAVDAADLKYEPHVIATYLLALARAFSAFYEKCPVAKEENPGLKAARLELVKATRNVLETGLGLLNIKAPREM